MRPFFMFIVLVLIEELNFKDPGVVSQDKFQISKSLVYSMTYER